MLAKRLVEFPTLGYWPGFAQVATRPVNAFAGPFRTLGRCPTKGGACTGEPSTLGYFDSGADLSGWGLAEWGTVGVVGYLLVTSFLTTKRGVDRVRKSVGARRARARRRESLKRQLKSV